MRRATRFMSIRSTARLNCRASRWSSVSFEITSVEMDLRLDVTHVSLSHRFALSVKSTHPRTAIRLHVAIAWMTLLLLP